MSSRDEVYLEMCYSIARRSKDPSTKVGALISDPKAIVSMGYNGPPRTVIDEDVPLTRPEKYNWMIHAEHNAILFGLAARGSYMLQGCTLYTTGIPCKRCALIVVHVGIKRVVCGFQEIAMCDEEDQAVVKRLFLAGGVSLERR